MSGPAREIARAVRSLTDCERPLRSLTPGWAVAALALVMAVCAWAAVAVPAFSADVRAAQDANRPAVVEHDMDLYRGINARMARGDGYYAAALAEQRAHNFPTRPFFTVRSPILAWTTALIGLQGLRVAAALLLVTAAALLPGALGTRVSLVEKVAAVVGLFLSGQAGFIGNVGLSHELLAGLLLTAAFAVRRTGLWWPALVLAALAVALRELAAPFLLVWAVVAVVERRWRELSAIALAMVVLMCGYAAHAAAVHAHGVPGDAVSPPWAGFHGPALVLSDLIRITPLVALPEAIAAPLAVLPLLGWAALGGRNGLFTTLWFGGMMMAIAAFARLENFYWLALLLPLYGAGLAFVPRALGDLLAVLGKSARRGVAA